MVSGIGAFAAAADWGAMIGFLQMTNDKTMISDHGSAAAMHALSMIRNVTRAALVDHYLHVQLTSFAPCAPPTHAAVLPSGHVTEQVCNLSALLDEQLLNEAAVAGFAGSSDQAGSAPAATLRTMKTEAIFKLRMTCSSQRTLIEHSDKKNTQSIFHGPEAMKLPQHKQNRKNET